LFLVSPGFEFFHSLLEWAVSLGMSCLPAVPAFNVILRVLSPTGLLPILEITGMAVLKLTGGLLGILFHSTVIDIVFLLLAILTNRSHSTIGVEKVSGRVVSRIADLIVG